MIHYIYRIDFLCGEPGRYYLGKHSYRWKNFETCSYAGSGNFCRNYYKKYGKIAGKTYIKTIIEVNDSLEINKKREAEIIGDLWKTDPLCMNLCPGGKCECSKVNSKRIVQYDINGNVINKFDSIAQAGKITGADPSSISKCCNGNKRRKIIKGFIWRYEDDPFDKFITPKQRYTKAEKYRKINQYTIKGTFVKTWDSIYDIFQAFGKTSNGCDFNSILNHKGRSKTLLGYRWEFYNGSTDDIKPLERLAKYPVRQYDLDGNFIKEYTSCTQAAKAVIGNHHGEHIKDCADGIRSSAHGYKWVYVE